ncbi:hypothetical protein POM88_034478 [Heracleum sosnowskyi]|uniref:Uncharacterized protein n=1 Tax=Heracleum sosnowskyi TaxID=360622 RepID=A0AAD8MCB5_9APIA|nr:hypothetical protein POM88_034478 [Heracleum sosnowskyi]
MVYSSTLFSSSGKVEYAITNHVAFMKKESVHADFHPLMDFLNNSPVSYALTARPTIYAKIVQEIWSSACISEAEIRIKINGKSYTITPSVINEALHLPNSNFESLPTDEEDLHIKDKDDTLQVFVQSKALFSHLVKNNFNGNVDFVLPRHIQVQVTILSSSPARVAPQSQSGTKAASSVSPNGKRKRTTLPTITTYYKSITVDGDEENETATEVHPPHKKMAASVVKPPRGTRYGVPVVELTSSEEDNPKCDLPPLEPSVEPNSQEEVLLDDRQHLVNAAYVLKFQLVARLTSPAEKLRTEDMNDLADRCYNALRELGVDCTSFRREVYKLITQHQKVEYAAKNKENWNDRDIKARYNQQVVSLSNMTKKLSSAEDKLSRAKTKREELKTALLRLTEELSEEEDTIKTLTEERDECKEAHSEVEVEFEKLVVEKNKGYVAFEAIDACYNTARKEFERMTNQLLQSIGK